MGKYDYKLPNGEVIPFKISGATPTQSEMERITAYVSGAPAPAAAPTATTQVPEEDETGIAGAFGAGLGAGWNRIQAGGNVIGAGLAAASPYGTFQGLNEQDWLKAAQAQRDEAGTYWTPKNDFTAEPGLYNKARNLAYQFGVSAPAMGAGLGAALLSPVGAPAALTIGAIASGAASFPQIIDENVEAQQQQNNGKVKDWSKVWVASGANSAIEGISDRVTFGLAGILGPTVTKAVRPLVTEAASKAAAKVFPELARKVGAATAGSIITGAMEEATQAAVTRWNAEKPLGDADAQKDYLENAIVGGLLQGGMAMAISPLTARAEIKQREYHQSWDDAYKDAEKRGKEKVGLYEEATKQPPPPAPEFIPALEDRSGPSKEQRYLKENPLSIEGAAAIVGNREEPAAPRKRSKVTEEEYRSVVDGLRGKGMISPGRIRKEFGFNDNKSHTILEMMKERDDVREAGDSQNRYYKVKSGEEGVSTPDRKIRVGEANAENKTPYTLRKADGSQIGKNSFKTHEEAHQWAVDSGVAGKVPFTIARDKDKTGGFAVYEDSYTTKKLPDGTTENVKVGVKTLSVHPDARSANLAARELDPNISPETNEVQAEAPRKKYLSQLKEGSIGAVQQGIDNVVGEGRVQLTVKDGVLTAEDTGDPNTPRVIEGFMRTIKDDADDRVKGVIQVAAALLDKNNPDLDLKGVAYGHELGHFVVGMLNPQERGQLSKLANSMKVPGKNYTWFQQEAARSGENFSPEEMVVEMMRGYVNDPKAFDKPSQGLLKKIIEAIRKLLGMSGNDGRDLLDAIYNRGLVKDREFAHRKAGDAFFSTVPVQGFYMKSGKVLESAKQDKASPEQWMGILKNSGVKQDELDWLGLEDAMKDYLRTTNSKSVPKNELINYIKANGLEVDEWVADERLNKAKEERHLAKDNLLKSYMFGDNKHRWEEYKNSEYFSVGNNHNIVFPSWLVMKYPDEPLVELYAKHDAAYDALIDSNQTKHPNTVQPGGEDYTEMVFLLPNNRLSTEEMLGKPSHFPGVGSNKIAHVRFNVRTIDGKRALFIEEMQSDWHQAGQQHGYRDADAEKRMEVAREKVRETEKIVTQIERQSRALSEQLYNNRNLTAEQKQEISNQQLQFRIQLREANHNHNEALSELNAVINVVPNAPLKSNWDEFVMKRLIRYAAENDFDYIAWHGEPESVAHTEGYYDFQTKEVDGDTKYYGSGGDNLTSIFNRYLAPQGLRSVAKKLGKKFNSIPQLYDPIKTPTALTSKPYFNNIDDIGSLSSQIEDPEILRKLNLLEQLFYQNHGMDDVSDAQAIEYQNKVGLTNAELERFAREAQGSENDPDLYKRWMFEIPKDMKESALGEGFPLFSAVTESPQFQKWFSGSHVRDKDGNPMVMYHGTSKDKIFDTFKIGRRGAWFTNQTWEASMYATDNDSKGFKFEGRNVIETNTKDRVIPVFLNIKNPYEMTPKDHYDLNKRGDNYAKNQANYFDDLRAKGYDGVKMYGDIEDKGHQIWVAFDPKQIKSIFNTEFSSSDPRYSAITETAQFKRWFAGSKLTTQDGKPLIVYHATAANFDRFGRVQAVDAGWYGAGHYFSPDVREASQYFYSEGGSWPGSKPYQPFAEGSRMIPAFISMKNPYYWPEGKSAFKSGMHKEARKFTEDLKSQGYDGVIYGSTEEYGYIDPVEVVAFYPEQIKSIWNQEFDPSDPKYSTIAWHGTGHLHNKFDTKYIGSGEGAQIYGWGLYFSDLEKIAKRYRDMQIGIPKISATIPKDLLSNDENDLPYIRGAGRNDFLFSYDLSRNLNVRREVRRAIQNYLGWQAATNKDKGRLSLDMTPERIKEFHNDYAYEYPHDVRDETIAILKKIKPEIVPNPGRVFNVNIPDREDMMIWDAEFVDQPDLVQQAFKAEGYDLPENITGEQIYRQLEKDKGTPEKASKYLKSLGIPAHRYLDANSKLLGAFDPRSTFNYVVYDHDDIEINNFYSAVGTIGARVNPQPAIDMMRKVEMQQTYDNIARGINKFIDKAPLLKDVTKYKAKQLVDGSVIGLQDRMLPLGRLIDRIKKNGGYLSNDSDAYLQHTLMSGQTQYALEQTQKNFFKPLGDAIKAITISDADWRDLKTINAAAIEFLRDETDKRNGTAELYLYAQHAQERNALMFDRNVGVELRNEQAEAGSGMTNEEAQQILHFVNTRPDLRHQLASLSNANSIRSRMRALIAHTNDVRQEGGLDPDFGLIQLEDGREMPHFDDYVPLRGFALEHPDGDKEAIDFARAGKGYKIRGKEDKSALGRRSMATEIIPHAMLQSSEAVVRAGKNKVSMAFVNMVRDNAELLHDIAEIVHVAPMKWALDSRTGKVRRVFNQQFANRDDILIGKEDGKEIMVQIHDEKVAKALLTRPNMGNGSLAILGDALLSINRFLAAMRTAYSPEFMLSNLLRDLQAAALNMSELEMNGLRSEVIGNLPKALGGAREVIRKETTNSEWAKAFVDFQKAGGKTAYMGLTELEDMVKKVNESLKDGNNLSQIKKGFNSLKDWVEDYNTVIENGIRLSTFNTLRNRFANGSTDPATIRRANERAAFISKNLTVNFNAGGELKPLMNAMYLFYNASMQGSLALVNPLIRSSRVRKIWMGVIAAGLMQDLLMSMISPEDDDGNSIYDNIPDYISDNKMIFVDPFGFTDRGYLAFPMPYLMNSIYGIGRHMGRVIRGKESPIEASKSMVFDLAGSMNPWGQSNTFLNWVAPTLMDPIVDLAVNTDAFGKPIAKEGSPYGLDEKASARYWNNTSQPYITVADWLSRLTGSDGAYMPGAVEVSPNQIGYVMDFLGGAVWSFGDRVMKAFVPGYSESTIFDAITGADFSANDIPFVRVFYGNISEREDNQNYIAKRDDVLRVQKSMKEAAEAGDSQRYQQLMRDYPNEYRIAARINALETQRRKLSRQLNKIRDSNKLSAERKAELEKTIKEQQNEIIGRANRLLKEV